MKGRKKEQFLVNETKLRQVAIRKYDETLGCSELETPAEHIGNN